MIDPLICKNCYHRKEDHRYQYLECENYDFTWSVRYDCNGIAYPERSIISKQCKCKAFQPFEDICGNKITIYVDKDLPDGTIAVWSHKAAENVK